MPNHEDDSQNQALYISDFILKRHLVYLYASSSISAILDPLAESLEPAEILGRLGEEGGALFIGQGSRVETSTDKEVKKRSLVEQMRSQPDYDMYFRPDLGFIARCREGEFIGILPQDRRYITCYLKHSMEQIFIMVDDHFLVLISPTIKNNKLTVGHLMAKIKHKEVWRIFMMSRKIKFMSRGQKPRGSTRGGGPNDYDDDEATFDEMTFYFEDWRKCLETKEYFIDRMKEAQTTREMNLIENLVVETCEREVNQLLSIL